MYTEEQKKAIWNFISGNAVKFQQYNSPGNFDNFEVENTTIIEYLKSKGFTNETYLVRDTVRRADNFVIFLSDENNIELLILILDLELKPIEALAFPVTGKRFSTGLHNDLGSGYIYILVANDTYQNYTIVELDDPILNKAIKGEYEINLLNEYEIYSAQVNEAANVNLIAKNETSNDFIAVISTSQIGSPATVRIRKISIDMAEVIDYPYVGEANQLRQPYEIDYSFYNNEFVCYLYGATINNPRPGITQSVVKYKTGIYQDGDEEKNGLLYQYALTYSTDVDNIGSISTIKKYGNSIIIKTFYEDADNYYNQLAITDIDHTGFYEFLYPLEKTVLTKNFTVLYIPYFINNNIFYIKRIVNTTLNTETTQAAVVKIEDGTINWKTIYDGEAFNISLFEGIGINNFNLYKFKVIDRNLSSAGETQLIYDPNAYNGAPPSEIYLGNTVANQIALTSGEKAVFARDLYNKVISGNITTSTVQVPNQVLNESQIDGQVMISQNNTQILQTTSYFEKNIFENVLFNIITTLNIIDKNNENNPIPNQNVSNIINYALQNIEVYDTVKMTKARLTFDDGTNKIIHSDRGYYVLQNRGYAAINFFVPEEKKCIKIEFISENENIIYITKEVNLDGGKYYIINQYTTIQEEMI